MTKSVKEKERLSSIRNYKSKGIPVPAELLKIKIRFWKSRFKEDNTNRDFLNLVEPCKKYFKTNINRLMFEIANKIEIYNFKIEIFVRTGIKKEVNVYVYNNNKYLGLLSLGEPYESSIDTNFSNFIPLDNNLSINNDKISNILNACELIICQYDMRKGQLRLRYNKTYFKALKIFNSINTFLKDLDLEKYAVIHMHMNSIYRNFFVFGKDINIVNFSYIKNVPRYYKYPSLDIFSEIEVVKMLINLKHIEIDISDEELIIENIDRIKNLIRLNNY